MRTSTSRALPAILALLAASCAGGSAPPATTIAATPSGSPSITVQAAPTAAAAMIPQLVVKLSEHRYEGLPTQLEAGLIEVIVDNVGMRDHELLFTRLKEGTYESFKAGLAKGLASVAPTFDGLGGPDRASPGERTRAILDLVEGEYALWSSVPIDGGPEVITKSMHQGIRVVAATRPSPARPIEDLVLSLKDGIPQVEGDPRAGTVTVKVMNAGPRIASAPIFKLSPGKTATDFATWLKERKGARPFVRSGGVVNLSPGRYGWSVVDLSPGEYVIYNLQAAQQATFTVK